MGNRDAWRRLRAALVAVADRLDTPYEDDPRWTPWTRFVKPAIEDTDADIRFMAEQMERLQAYADGETDKLRDALRKLDEQDDLINRLASVVNTANEYVAAHPCDHPSGCAYRDDLNRSISYAPGRKP